MDSKKSILYTTIKLEEEQIELNNTAEAEEFLPLSTSCALASGECTPIHSQEGDIQATNRSAVQVLPEDIARYRFDTEAETSLQVPSAVNYIVPSSPLESQHSSRRNSAWSLNNFQEKEVSPRQTNRLGNMPEVNFQNHKLKCASAVIIVFLAIVTAIVMSSLHRIEEGNVGVYYKYGALMDSTTGPGIHYMSPFVVDVEEVQIRPQTDTLDPITAITKDGIQNTFLDVQVISRVKVAQLVPMIKTYGNNFREALITDRVKEELRKFCANHTIDDVYKVKFLEIAPHVKKNLISSIDRLGNGGMEILNLVIPKPNIPADIASNYKQVKVQWTKQLAESQQQITETIRKETEKLKALADAERTKAVLEINIQQQILEREGNQNISRIENQIRKEKEESIADIAKYKATKEAESNTLLYTDQYVQLEMAKSLTQNTKLYFSGQNSEIGALMGNIFKNNN